MRVSLRTCVVAFFLLSVFVRAAWAQFDDGIAAMDTGDYGKALTAWQLGADAGDSRAQYGLGYLYQFGLAGPADQVLAMDWYQKAAAAGNPDALYALGLMYETGHAGHRDLAQAMDFYRKAAATGLQPDAEYAVGRMILRGRGVPRNPAEGIQWIKRAALHDQTAAQYMLGAAYEAGWGVTVNDAEAYYWYRRSEAGDAVALAEQDVAFQPKIAIESLRRRLSTEVMARQDARLSKDLVAARLAAKADTKTLAKIPKGPAAPTEPAPNAKEQPRPALTSPPSP